MPQVVPLQFRLRLASSPINGGAFWCGINSYIKPALKGEVGFAQAKAGGVKKEEASLGFVNPSVNPPCGVLPAPRKGEPFGSPLTKSCPRWRGKWTRSGRKGNG